MHSEDDKSFFGFYTQQNSIMKILYIACSSRIGGANVALYNLVKGLKDKHEIHIIFPEEGPISERCEMLGVICHFTPYRLTLWHENENPFRWVFINLKSFIKLFKVRSQVEKVIQEVKPDIVQTDVGPLDIALDTCRKLRIPHVWHLREYQDLDFKMHFFPSKQYFKKKILQKGNFNVAITKGVFDYWNLRSIDKVIYDGVFTQNTPLLQPIESEKENYFLFVGRIEEAKGVHVLLNAFGEFLIKHPNFRLLLAGAVSENYYARCMEIVNNNGIKDSIEFLGEREDVYSLMSKAKALVVPSRFEGFGFITAEAMVNGCLVIGKDTAGTKEQFDIGKNMVDKEIGLRFLTEEELLESMFYAVDADTIDMRNKARHVALSNYSIEKHAEYFDNYYKSILSL